MRKFVYNNATVYITEPTQEQLENIRRATEEFVMRLAQKGMIDDGYGRQSNRGTRRANSHARSRNKKVEEKDTSN